MPGVGPKPLKDFTDEDIKAVAGPFQERAARLGNPAHLDCSRLVLLAREEERESLSASRLALGLSVLWEWLAWQLWYRWHWGRRQSEADQIVVDLAGGSWDLE